MQTISHANRSNIATQVRNGTANIATCDTSIATDVDKINNNIATDHLSENKRIIDDIVRSKVKRRMSRGTYSIVYYRGLYC